MVATAFGVSSHRLRSGRCGLRGIVVSSGPEAAFCRLAATSCIGNIWWDICFVAYEGFSPALVRINWSYFVMRRKIRIFSELEMETQKGDLCGHLSQSSCSQ